jgi:hypothetical protein
MARLAQIVASLRRIFGRIFTDLKITVYYVFKLAQLAKNRPIWSPWPGPKMVQEKNDCTDGQGDQMRL